MNNNREVLLSDLAKYRQLIRTCEDEKILSSLIVGRDAVIAKLNALPKLEYDCEARLQAYHG